MTIQWVGWVSSFVLVLTLSKQLRTQWKARRVEGVSKWLYLGQLAAEVGFIVYSWETRSWVFLFTNGVLLLENLLGFAMLRARRREGGQPISRASAA